MSQRIFYLAFISISFLCSALHAREVLIPTDTIAQTKQNNYYIISVGINQYQDAFWPDLKWPVSDARKVANSFGQNTQYRLQKYNLFNNEANLKNIQRTLIELGRKISFEDTVIFYFSGHGTLAQNDLGELSRIAVLHDTRNDALLSTGLSHQWLRQWLDSLKAKKKMMIFATCNSGVGKSRVPPAIQELLFSQKGKLISLEDVSEGALILAAAAKGEAAREDDNLQGDIYTHFLLEALSIYDRNHDGMISALEAHDYAREKTWAFTRGRQRPTADVKLIGNADIPLQGKKLRTAVPILEAYDEELAGFQVQVDNGIKGQLPLAFALKPEGSEINLYAPVSGQEIARYKVKLDEGNTISLDQVINNRPVGLSIGQRMNQWQDKGWSTLSGSNKNHEFIATLSWHRKHFGIGMAYPLQLLEYSNKIRPTLEAEATLQSPYVFMEYRKPWKRFSLGLQAQLGYETLEVSLKDTVNKDQLNYKDRSISYGLVVSGGYEIFSDLDLKLDLGMKQVDWQFNTIGDLNGKRYLIGMTMHYQFDWRVKRL